MRSDIADMNPGKACAQAAHAQAEFSEYANKAHGQVVRNAVNEWCGDRMFGRTIVLSGTKDQIGQLASSMEHSGMVIDPTYPWRNYYKEVFVSSELTCGWVFVCDSEGVSDLLAELKLHV